MPDEVVELIEKHTARDFLDVLYPLRPELAGCVFRGHADAGWALLPSSVRRPGDVPRELWRFDGYTERWHDSEPESRTLKMFKRALERQGISIGPSSDGRYDPVAGIAQHNGVRTQLLDWTNSPYVAAYFAARENVASNLDAPICVWVAASGPQAFTFGEIRHPEPSDPPDLPPRPVSEVQISVSLGFPSFDLSVNANMRAQQGELMAISVYVAKPGYDALKEQGAKAPIVEPLWIPLAIDEMLQSLEARFPGSIERSARLPVFRKVTLDRCLAAELLVLLDRLGFSGASVYPGIRGAVEYAIEKSTLHPREKPY